MSVDPQSVQALFARAIEIGDRSEREKFLIEQCNGDAKLYERVAKLLVAFDGSKGFLDQPTQAVVAAPFDTGSRYQPGHVISGRYKLLEAIGEGGMGTVWVAEQSQPVRRKVALKLVKPGMDSKQVLARFDAERQALALMDHPNIAKVFDGGVTDQGRPFFAMELVKGMPLTEYCDSVRLPVEARLKLFVPICQAVQHAHQKGIIHRDLKPSNVLICLYDGKPVPKVIDFGLAKAMHQPLTEQTVHTGFGLMIGTPLYMSPEQAEHNNLDVDTRSDVYSLGVMLYELLTGSTPLEKAQFKDAAFGEVLRLIKEVEPPKPSTRVSSSAELPNIAAQRNLDPSQLGRSIRGDLDWIVMKAIEKERGRRYETANGLARDIERFLNLEAVEACPPSTSYRLRRLARKYRAMIGTAAAFSLILILGAGLSVWQAFRATKAETLASRRLIDVQAEQVKTQEALKESQESERRAIDSESTAVAAREAEETAKTAEAQQRQLAEQQRDEAKRLQVEATAKSNALQALTEEQRRVIYVSQMNQVRIEAQRGNLARMREILLEQLPIDGKEDLRGFEWNYWCRYLNQAKTLNKFDKVTIDTRGSALVTVMPGGRQVAWTQGRNTELVDLQDGTSRRLPFQLRHYVDRTRFSDSGRAVVGACLSHTYPSGTYKPPGSDQGSTTSCSVVEPTGQVHTFTYPADGFKHISALNISRDGSLVTVIGYDASHSRENVATRICVWNVDSRQLILNEVYRRELNRGSFSPDGTKIAAHLCHGTKRNSDETRDIAVIIDVATGRELAVAQHDDDVDSLFWIPGSDRVLLATLGFSGANRKQLISWRTEGVSARPELLTRETTPDYVNGAVSPDGSTLAIASHLVNHIRLFDTVRGDLIDTLQTDGKGIVSLTYSDDGQRLIATTVTGEVLQWELGKDRDLYALRTKPLPRLATNGYTLSQDQSLLGLALAEGTLLIRTREGAETKLRLGNPKASLVSAVMRFSPDKGLLAFCTNVGPDGKLLSGGKGLLEVYDLNEKRRLWQTYCSTAASAGANFFGSQLEFSSDGQKLIHVSKTSDVVDARTGNGTALDLRKNRQSKAFISMRRDNVTGSILATLMEESGSDTLLQTSVFDPLTGSKKFDVPSEIQGLPISAPDGIHLAVYYPSRSEIWNLHKGESVLSVQGVPLFSPDSKLIAVLAPKFKSPVATFNGIAIWDLVGRRQLCELSLAGDALDDARFSPDGKRLLTLEGKVQSSGIKIPRGRLWDVETGREILDLPVAEVNHYDWDFFFDASGQQLTRLVFTKSAGTIGGGATAFYDARPLEPSIDNELAADRLIALLTSKLALKREWIAEIESRSNLKPGIRDAVLAKVRDAIANPGQIAKLTGEIVGFNNRTAEDYQRAIVWAEELHRLEPSSFRGRSLLGAAYYRTDRLEDALRVLTASESNDQGATDSDQGYDKIRHTVLALVYHRMGKNRNAQDSYEMVLKLKNQIQEPFAFALNGEAAAQIPKRVLPTAPELMPTDDNLKRMADQLSSILGIADLELSKWPSRLGHRLVTYDADLDHRLNQEELLAALTDMHRYGFVISKMEGLFPIESQLDFLDESIREAPRYLTARFARSWLRATSANPQFRDAEKAIEEAKAICEQTEYQDPTFLEGLAAAYAASNDFSSAVRWQTEAVRLHREAGTQIYRFKAEMEGRLSTYEKHQNLTSHFPNLRELISKNPPDVERPRESSVPYFAPDAMFRCRRIVGTNSAWSPDGSKIVRRVKSGEASHALEWIDHASGETKLLCEDGFHPVWAMTPSEKIYFQRAPAGTTGATFSRTTMSKMSIWQCDPDGQNLRRLTEGYTPSLLKDGSLMVARGKLFPEFSVVSGFRINQSGQWVESGFEWKAKAYSVQLSPDGKLIAESGEDFTIRDVASKRALHTFDNLSNSIRNVDGAWSPHSRYYVYGSLSKSTISGLWILDVQTGVNRLLADIDATNPSWSHDGRFIAVDERGKNKIVILDVSSLQLENGLGNSTQQAP